ncbi:hypothetical protein [Methanoculleus chikugoensis]|uniref:hypothetical protein n=1 Tax=Methanoculleus chikugoensis TaxID=118126 RepID=UPI001FB35B8D|nr:hypothetical protein [Methanoculleus chikugoensis]
MSTTSSSGSTFPSSRCSPTGGTVHRGGERDVAADLYPGRGGIRRTAVTLLIAVLLCSAGCMAPALQEPTITLSGVGIENITPPGSTDLLLHFIIDNPPNPPIGATLTRVSFDVYFIDGGQWVFLAHGERGRVCDPAQRRDGSLHPGDRR